VTGPLLTVFFSPKNIYLQIRFIHFFKTRFAYVILWQDQYYTFSMFDVCGLYIVKVLLGEINLPDIHLMQK
jgi:hypothetical protein